MSILIKGMEMPDNCYVCPFMFHQRRATEVWCTAIENHWLDLREVLSCDRHNDCPLVPVPPHGRLIDADAFTKDECNNCDGACEALPCDCLNCKADCRCDFMQDIANAPTIIPAEESKA